MNQAFQEGNEAQNVIAWYNLRDRWFDLVRTGQAHTVMQKYGMKLHNTVFPIPLAQI